MKLNMKGLFLAIIMAFVVIAMFFSGCKPKGGISSLTSDAASKVYVPPGSYDEFYLFTSGGFSGQLGVYGLPSGRLLREIPIFSFDSEEGYGFSEETKAMLETSFGFIPWDDSHHPELSQTNGEVDGRWLFINANNTPRIARVDLTTFTTEEIIELPNTGGNHASAFITDNNEYVVSASRFSIPIGQREAAIDSYKEEFDGVATFISVDPKSGTMSPGFQLILPPFDYDLAHTGKGPSSGWMFFTCYNSEEANTLLEVNASQRDKDFIMAINWKKVEEYVKSGNGTKMPINVAHNYRDHNKGGMAVSERYTEITTIKPEEIPGLIYYIPCPKSPHGCDVDPTGQYFCAGGKLAAVVPVYSFEKMQQAIASKSFEGDVEGIPVLKYDAVLQGEVKDAGLGPLHTEFDNEGNAYTSFFVSSEIVKWKVATQEVIDKAPTYYSIGHLCVPGGDSRKPWGKYVIALNKITKDRYLPTGPALTQSAQLYSIEGEKMELLLDFPTIGEPHYAQALPAELIKDKQVKIFKIEESTHPYVAKGEKEATVYREGNIVHVKMTSIRSHFNPDNIEGIRVGDVVYFHVTNLEQDWDVPHGFAIQGAENAELLIMPGETLTLKWVPKRSGVFPMYCTDFCSALHQEMQGYVRVSPAGSNVPLKFHTNNKGL
ncbi:MAG: Sec-dependent nitrous-oxide reductase [Chitinophagales bacterium]|nr:Sec-dependent nitrous-oxide reductase [Chitinophagales bacterium]HQU40684.1 Sec-dependent nitrous-oxide reductase [Chitinophagales bacterium]HQU75419.1 Sec-dependent nitrous-oxide reductase [Chitinophagales bacterium]HRX25035.1 Sec-dependent nitrous-oxide reductase [Chitinophagales bacterium]